MAHEKPSYSMTVSVTMELPSGSITITGHPSLSFDQALANMLAAKAEYANSTAWAGGPG